MSTRRAYGGEARRGVCSWTSSLGILIMILTSRIHFALLCLTFDHSKCLECKRVVGLSSVAMIKGDLYCKNCLYVRSQGTGRRRQCELLRDDDAHTRNAPSLHPSLSPFHPLSMRIFKREGKYSSFGDKTLPKGAAGADGVVSPEAAEVTAAAPTERRASVILSCVVADCSAPRVARKNYCLEHLNSGAGEVSSATSDLLEAIAAKSVDKVKAVLETQTSTAILFQPTPPRNITPIEAAFTGIQNSRACGEAMLAWLQAKVQALEAAASPAASTTPTVQEE